jgi:large subunit ribosomal protein L21
MYAVFEDGSRQYRVAEGDVVTVDYRDGVEKGTRLEFSKVLLYSNGGETRIGQPTIEGLRVLTEVVDFPSKKYYIQKYKKRKNYRRFKGHRQWFTQVKVRHILLPGVEAPPAPTPAPAEQPAPSPAPAQ